MIERLGEGAVRDIWKQQQIKYKDKLRAQQLGLDKEEGPHLIAQFRETIPEGGNFSPKKFREWLPKYREQQARERAAARAKFSAENTGGVGPGSVGAGVARQGNALADRLRAFLAANPEAVKAPAESSGEYPQESAVRSDSRQAGIDLSRSIAEQMKRAARGE